MAMKTVDDEIVVAKHGPCLERVFPRMTHTSLYLDMREKLRHWQ